MSAERRRLPLALLLSLLIHALLLSLTFGGQSFGLPGFAFPWKERRMEAPDLQVLLVPAQVITAQPAGSSGTLVKEPLQQALIEQTVSGGTTPIPSASASSAPMPGMTAVEIVPKTKETAQIEPEPVIATSAVPAAGPAKTPLRTEGFGDVAPTPSPAPVVIAVERSNEPTFVVPPPVPTPVIAVAPSPSIPETVMPIPRDAAEATQKRAEPEVRERVVEVAKPDPPERDAEQQRQANQLEAARVEAAKLEAARQEAARIETARLAAAQLEAQRQDVARQAAVRVEAARMEAARQEVARVEAARLEAQRQEATRLVAAQLEAQRKEAARLEAARLESDRQEAVRQAAVQAAIGKEAARILAEKEEDARREARRQAMGRTLNEEAAQREAVATTARSPSTLPYSLSTARRFRLWGRSDPNVELVEYAEAWGRKIQFNTPVDTVREVAKRPHTNPMVTVAIRSDGSVESVTFVLSSGVAEVDEAIRRIVQSQAPNLAFPPGLAREVDVIEVRRTWHFDTAVRLY